MRIKKRIPSSVFAFGVAAILGFGVYSLASSGNAPAIQKVIEYKEKEAPTTNVLVTKMEIQVGKRLSAVDFQWIPWPNTLLDANFITEQTAGDKGIGLFDGHIARFPFSANEPITHFKVVKPGERSSISGLLRDGMRAIAISISPDNSAGGLIQPGDIVDVLITTNINLRDELGQTLGTTTGIQRALSDPELMQKNDVKPKLLSGTEESKNLPSEKFYDRINDEKNYLIAGMNNYTETLLENVRVLGIGQSLDTSADTNGQPQMGATATLEVTPQQAKLLAWGSMAGRMTLTLRSLVENSVEGDERQLDIIPRTTSTYAIPLDGFEAQEAERPTDQLNILRSSARPSTVHAPSFDMLRASTESNTLPDAENASKKEEKNNE